MSTLQPLNVLNTSTGVFPPTPGATVKMAPRSQYSYYLMTRHVEGPHSEGFLHTDTCHPETVVTLDGSYSIEVNGKRVYQNAGDVLVIPTGAPHGNVVSENGFRNLQIENTHPGYKSRPKS